MLRKVEMRAQTSLKFSAELQVILGCLNGGDGKIELRPFINLRKKISGWDWALGPYMSVHLE